MSCTSSAKSAASRCAAGRARADMRAWSSTCSIRTGHRTRNGDGEHDTCTTNADCTAHCSGTATPLCNTATHHCDDCGGTGNTGGPDGGVDMQVPDMAQTPPDLLQPDMAQPQIP